MYAGVILVCVYLSYTAPTQLHTATLVRTWRGGGAGWVKGWGRWSGWSECGVTCGQGVVTRRRRCRRKRKDKTGTRRVSSGCVGKREQLKLCYRGVCEDGEDYESVECAVFNNISLYGVTINTWTPSQPWRGDCSLICDSQHTWLQLTYSFGHVKDGSECLTGVCVRGECVSVGCDGVVGSGAELDKCGECGGTGLTCSHVSHYLVVDTSNRRPRYSDTTQILPHQAGIHPVLTIPRGATNIWIEDESPYHLAIRTRDQGIIVNSVYGDHQEEQGFILMRAEHQG